MLKKTGGNQFGSIPKFSTAHALLSKVRGPLAPDQVHFWTKHTDGTGTTIRVEKVIALDFPYGILYWIIYFLNIANKESNKTASGNG